VVALPQRQPVVWIHGASMCGVDDRCGVGSRCGLGLMRPDSDGCTQRRDGDGGPPSADNFCEDPSLPSCLLASTRNQTAAFGYGRLTVHNATHLTYEQFNNGSPWSDARCSSPRAEQTRLNGQRHNAAENDHSIQAGCTPRPSMGRRRASSWTVHEG
jgi:hypothetical protein